MCLLLCTEIRFSRSKSLYGRVIGVTIREAISCGLTVCHITRHFVNNKITLVSSSVCLSSGKLLDMDCVSTKSCPTTIWSSITER